jgi:4-hydroxyphenylpyruvate dioxygenase-like putative hemolysin
MPAENEPHKFSRNRDERLQEEALQIADKRKRAGLDGLVGGLQCVIVNTEPQKQQDATDELLRSTGHYFDNAFESAGGRTCVLRKNGSADILVTSRTAGANPFAAWNAFPKSRHLRNTRVETFVFTTPDLKRYVAIQRSLGVAFLTEDIIEADDFLFIQTPPSQFTGNSVGFLQWRGQGRRYELPGCRRLDSQFQKPVGGYQANIIQIDHAATRVQAEHRDPAILEFMSLTNYKFEFAIYVDPLNSITNVARLPGETFAMVFTSGVAPYVSDAASGPTEKYVHRYGPRVHHLAFHTERIEEVVSGMRQDGVPFLVKLVGSAEEGLKQAFTAASPHTLVVNEYIHRYEGFDGFFARHNVAILTEATGKQ